MKKISCVVLFSSPHKNGNSANMLNSFLEKIELPADIKVFDAYKLNAAPCIDCGYCKISEECAFHDIDELYEAIENCDLLVIAAPIYNLSFPSPLKAIIDRFQKYYNARFSRGKKPAIEKHRKAVLLAAAGSENEDGEMMIRQLEQSFSVMNTELISSAVINNLDKTELDVKDERIILCAEKTNRILSVLCH